MKWLVLLALAAFIAGAQAHEADLTRLPLGDGKISTGPKAGWIWACRVDPNGGGARVAGPWIKSDGTYDFTAKAVVPGDVRWPSRYGMRLDGENRVFSLNDLPNHGTGTFPVPADSEAYRIDPNPNAIAAQNFDVTVPANPVLAAQPSCAPGAVGILTSGAVLFNALDAPGRDAVAHEVQDKCQGHPQPSGVYHYHSLTNCLEDKRDADGHSALVGYALDGFGIYGRFGEGGVALSSADLDECHGHTHAIEWNGKRVTMYHYHATRDFPYTIGCLRGTWSMQNMMAISGGPPRGRFPGGPFGRP
ncbi:MAG: YHYH protein [Alphaproteobacteria bacterium]|nr:YHYH protein [Alphaproteobacteria bacterium]